MGLILGTVLALLLLLLILFWFLFFHSLAGDGTDTQGGQIASGHGPGPAGADNSQEESGAGSDTGGEDATPQGGSGEGDRGSQKDQQPQEFTPSISVGINLPTSEGRGNQQTDGSGDSSKPQGRGGGSGILGGGGGGADGTEFFGIESFGNKVVFVIDHSRSMEGGQRFEKACAELLASITAFTPRQKFCVYLYNHETLPMFGPQDDSESLLRATESNLTRLRAWVEGVLASGGTKPLDAMQRALKLRPDVVFLLTDGAFEEKDNVADSIRDANKSKSRINTICFTNRLGEAQLKQIAKDSGGEYRFVP